MTHPPATRKARRCDACGAEGEGIGRFEMIEHLDYRWTPTRWTQVLCRPMLCNDCVGDALRLMTRGEKGER